MVVVAHAQVYPVQASLNITPPYSLYLSDYVAPGSMKLQGNIYLADLAVPSVDVRFRIKIEGLGIEIKTKDTYIGTRFSLISGVPIQVYGDQLGEYFILDNLDVSGLSRSQLASTGALPEGVYRFTLEVLEYNRGVQISNSAFATVWLVLNDPPVVNMPLKDQVINTVNPQIIRFQWTPRHKGSPNASFSTSYRLRIVEIWPENRNPNDALRTSNPVFEVTTQENYYVYGVMDPSLVPGRRYAFDVQAIPNTMFEQHDLFKNRGFSEVSVFKFGEACNPPEKIDIIAARNKSIELAWPVADGATAYTLSFRENRPDARWYESFMYLPKSTLYDLTPGKSYSFMVRSHCSTITSDNSDQIDANTTNIENDFICGDVQLDFDLDNKTSIALLNPGDVIYAGDFDVQLITVEKSGETFRGTGLAYFPFLQMLKTQVNFSNLAVNTDKRVFDGYLTTVYKLDSRFMANLDRLSQQEPENVPGNESAVDSSGISGDEIITEAPQFVDSVYVNTDGLVVTLVDGKEVIADLPPDGATTEYVDTAGNTIRVDSKGNITNSESSAPTSASANSGTSGEWSFEFGPLKIKLNEDQQPNEVNGECVFNDVSVDLALQMEAIEQNLRHDINLSSAVFSYKKNCATGEILSGELTWSNTGDANRQKFFGLDVSVNEFKIELDKEGITRGAVDLDAALVEDLPLSTIIKLRSGLSGGIRYGITRENDELKGSFDFGGLKGLNLDVVKGSKVLAKLEDGRFDADGVLTGKIRMADEVEFESSQFKAKLTDLVLDIEYSLGKDIIIHKGSLGMAVSGIKLLDGELKLTGEFLEDQIEASVSGRNLKAFGMKLTGLNLAVVIDEQLNINEIAGRLKANHPDFGVELAVEDLLIKNGTLEKFDFSGGINYRTIDVKIRNAAIEKENDRVVMDAFVETSVEGISIAAEVKEFSINSEGVITWGGYDININGVKKFGPLEVAISAAKGETSGKWRKTEAEASFKLDLQAMDEPIEVTGAKISYLKHKSEDLYKDIKISLEDAQSEVNLGVLNLSLNQLILELETPDEFIFGDGSNSALIKLTKASFLIFGLALEEDLGLGEMLYIKKGLRGSITYQFSGEGLDGTLDYSAVQGLNVALQKGDVVLASLANGTINQEGIIRGKVSALEGASFKANGFEMQVSTLEYNIEFPIRGSIEGVKIFEGHGIFVISGTRGIEGNLLLKFDRDNQGNILASISSEGEVKASSLQLKDFDLKVEMTADFEIVKIEGQATAQHKDFSNEIAMSDLLIEKGELKTVNLQGNVNFKGFNLKLSKADYNNGLLSITGEVEMNVTGSAAWLAVEELTIDEEGNVNIKGVNGEFDKSPIFISFSASFDDSRFKGSFTGEFTKIGVSGEIDIGSEEGSFDFAYLKLVAKGNLLLPGTGLKLTQLGGQFGYNYQLVYDKPGEEPEGQPQEGNYVVGLLIGVADLADMVEVTGNTVVQFGNDKFELDLNGGISVPRQRPMLKGDLNAHYVLPDNTLDGNVSVDVSIPPANGKVLEGNFDMTYAQGSGEWSVSTTNFRASLFKTVDFTGNIELHGKEEKPVTGFLQGEASYDFSYESKFSAFTYDFKTQLNAGFTFNGRIDLNEDGISGSTSLQIYANGGLIRIHEDGEQEILIELSAESLAQLSFNKDEVNINGMMTVEVTILLISYDVDVEIDKTI